MIDTLGCDVECYHGYFLVKFKRFSDGSLLSLEFSDRSELDRGRLANIMSQNRIVTFNGNHYDLLMIYHAVGGATNAELKALSDHIITSGKKSWDIARSWDIFIPKIDHIDLIEPNPSVRQSLKTLNGRLHGKRMQDLPIKPDAILTHADMDLLDEYCGNDLNVTHLLFDHLAEPLALREQLSAEYGIDLRSKSDAQIGETIVKTKIQKKSGRKAVRADVVTGSIFRYDVPSFIKFQTPQLQEVLQSIVETDFRIQASGKVEMPKALDGRTIFIGSTSYTMGIGGLHSNESNRAVHADEKRLLIDADVASQYPAIIAKLGLYPKAVGQGFLEVYTGIIAERLEAKRVKNKVKDQGFKIALNGTYGKLGSIWSVLYAPHLMIAVTLTGQLSLLMLIERAEAIGIPVVSGNTDGVLFHCPRELEDALYIITAQWELETGFKLEFANYRSIYNASVNTYVAVKDDGSVKRKGTVANPWGEGDKRAQLMKNPNATICSDAAVQFILEGVPIDQTIRQCRDVKSFVTVVNVAGGGTWRDGYLGKVVRYIWALDGDPILYCSPHPSTGNFKKASKTDGCRPLMELPDQFPTDIDYDRYIAEAQQILVDLAAVAPPKPLIKPVKMTTWATAIAWLLAA